MTRVRTKRIKKIKAIATPYEIDPNHKHKLGFLGYAFCSHEHNNHKPYLLRGMTLSVISMVAVFFMGVSFARYYFLHQTVLGQEIVSSVLIDLTNETRIKYGESPLVKSEKLEEAANLKANDMASKQYFAHNSPTGVTPWHWIKESGYNFIYAGENLAIDFTQSQDVEEAWLKSPTHRANILNSKFQEIGISTKEGMINGHKTIYVVQMFGTPKNEITLAKNNVSTTNILKTENLKDDSSEEELKTGDGEVAGANIENLKDKNEISESVKISSGTALQTANTIINQGEYVTLSDKGNMLVVADKEALENATNTDEIFNYWQTNNNQNNDEVIHYSNFWQKLLYNFWFDLNDLFKIIVLIISISVAILLFTEFKKHHWKHLFYGLGTILLLLLLLYFNQALW